MLRSVLAFAAIVSTIFMTQPPARAADYPPELAPMVHPIEEVEAMMADGTFKDGEFNPAVSNRDAATFANTVKSKLRTADAEYTRLPRKIRTSKEADDQWYRMDALIKTSKGFSKALQRHAQAAAEQAAPANAAPAAEPASAPVQTASTAPPPQQQPAAQAEAEAKAAERKREADVHAAAVRAQQEAVKARAAAVKAEKEAARQAKAAGIEPTGEDWRNSYIPNLKELETRDGFFQWPWSQPSWKAVADKAAEEQKKGALGSTQVAMFTDFVRDKAGQWPAVPRLDEAGDAQYAIEMIRKRESADGLTVVDLWISRDDWKIQRNNLGVILSRTKPGYMLYEDPSGEGCILKQFWIKEPYAGGEKYERTSSWRYARLRFQNCDRR